MNNTKARARRKALIAHYNHPRKKSAGSKGERYKPPPRRLK